MAEELLPIVQGLELNGIEPTAELVDYLLRLSQKVGELQRELAHAEKIRLSNCREAFVAGAAFYEEKTYSGSVIRQATVVAEAQRRYPGRGEQHGTQA